MNIPSSIDAPTHVATRPVRTDVPAEPTGPALEGQQAAEDLRAQLEPLRGFPGTLYYYRGGGEPSVEGLGTYKYVLPDMTAALERAQDDPEFAAAFFNELGPATTADLASNYDALVNGNDNTFDDRFNISDEAGIALLQDFAAALGSASRAGEGRFDGPAFMRELTGSTLEVGLSDVPFDPELAAILLNEGEYTPEAAAELGAYVLLNDDPPLTDYEVQDPVPSHRETMMTAYSGAPHDANGAWPTALRGLMANRASSEVLNLDGVAERLLDPDLQTSSIHGVPRVNEIPALVGALLEQPVADLHANPSDPAAMGAVEALLLGGKHYHGRVNEEGANAFGRLYTAFAPEILNAGEGASAFPLARNSGLGRFLADSDPLQAGDGSFALTAALGATGTPPLDPQAASPDPFLPSTVRFADWNQALAYATAQYRNQVEANGPPMKDAPGGGTYPDLNALATEIADIDGEFLTGVYGAEAIKAADIDDANAHQQQVFNVLTDYAGYAVGLGPAGATLSGGATLYNTHAEGAILEHFFPTDHAQRVFNETVPEHQQPLLAAQAVRIVDSAGQSGAVTLPPGLVDPQTGGLRVPEAGADADRFAADLADFIEATPALHEAIDLARSQLEERTNALDTGQYRGG